MELTFKDLLLQNKLGALADVPEGKHIGWNEQGQLELMDDPELRDITERIKTFVFLALGVRDTVRSLSKRAVTVIFCILLTLTAVGWMVTYMGMKARLTTAESNYSKLEQHTDSIEEAFNIKKAYSRITPYE